MASSTGLVWVSIANHKCNSGVMVEFSAEQLMLTIASICENVEKTPKIMVFDLKGY